MRESFVVNDLYASQSIYSPATLASPRIKISKMTAAHDESRIALATYVTRSIHDRQCHSNGGQLHLVAAW